MIKLAHSYSALKMFENCPKQYHHMRVAKDVQDVQGEAAIWGQNVHTDLELRLKGTQPLTAGRAPWEALCRAFEKLPGELHAEYEMTLNKDLNPTGWWADDAWLRSKIDVLVLHGANAVVADWKTGKRRPDFFQMELFAVQTFKHFPDVQQVKTSLVWLKTMEMDTETYTRDDAARIWGTVFGKIARIEEALEHGVWPARPSGLCPWCPARLVCEFAR